MVDERVGMALSGLSRCASAALGSRYRFGIQATRDADGGDGGSAPPRSERGSWVDGDVVEAWGVRSFVARLAAYNFMIAAQQG
jgi:hypothetical protein